MRYTTFLSVLFLSLAAGCGGGSDKSGDSGSTSDTFQYHYQSNGCDTGEKKFSSRSDLCSTLEDSTKNNYCALEDRQKLYQDKCGNDFKEVNPYSPPTPEPSPQPQPAPEPHPQPAPQPTPQPAPRPEPTGPKVLQDLAAAGITVKVDYNNEPNFPGEPSFQARLEKFWNTLLFAEDAILARKDKINYYYIADYGSFNLGYKSATLSVDMSGDNIRSFLGGADLILKLKESVGIIVSVGVIDYDRGHDGNKDLYDRIGFFEANEQQVAGTVKEIEISTTPMYNVSDRKLTLNYDTYQDDFARFAKVLSPARPFFQIIDTLVLKFTPILVFSSETDGDAKTFMTLSQALGKEKASLTALHDAGALEEVGSGYDENNFYPSTKNLSVATTGEALTAIHSTLAALAEQMKFSQETKIEFNYGYGGLKGDFVIASQHLSQVLQALRPKANLVRTIEFGEKSSFEYSVLTAGSKDSLAELRKVVEGIK